MSCGVLLRPKPGHLGHRANAATVIDRSPMGAQRRHVGRGAIAFVSGKTILRGIAVHLRHQRSRCTLARMEAAEMDCTKASPLTMASGRDIEGGNAVSVDQHHHGLQAQALHRTAHGQHGGLKDVELVDLFHAGLGNAAAQGLGTDFIKQLFAPGFGGSFPNPPGRQSDADRPG